MLGAYDLHVRTCDPQYTKKTQLYVPLALGVRATQVRFNFNCQPALKQRHERIQMNASFCACANVIYLPEKNYSVLRVQKLGAASLTWNSLSVSFLLLIYVSHSRYVSLAAAIAQSSNPVMYTIVECHILYHSIFVGS